ncbi:SSI family serine proteinase inhibitor [Streptomyces sp. NPDC006372]|uniref:SSI family serine proteinase inhibitor n=1 Tax=Streptomyces sp. NPDC006372 TaxID=3155599 RepID=UPI0033B6DD4F
MLITIRRGASRTADRIAPRPALRRLVVGAAASVAALGSLTAVSPVAYAQAPGQSGAGFDASRRQGQRLGLGPGVERNHLTVTVRNAGGGADGTFELYCGPAGGNHPDPQGACATLERGTRWGTDTFAPAPEGGFCTMQYGGPATAHVTGTWDGRPVDARYDRRDGCRIARWDQLVPLLPAMGSGNRH